MANTIRGKILAIEPIQEIASKTGGNPYHTRRLLLDATRYDGLTGERGQDNFIMFEFGGERDVHVPDSFKKDDIVEVSFRLRGVKYQKQGEPKPAYFVHVAGYKIEKVNVQGQQTQGGSQQSQQAQQSGNQQQPTPQQQGNAQGSADPDLPF